MDKGMNVWTNGLEFLELYSSSVGCQQKEKLFTVGFVLVLRADCVLQFFRVKTIT